jgi:hypothetical protein
MMQTNFLAELKGYADLLRREGLEDEGTVYYVLMGVARTIDKALQAEDQDVRSELFNSPEFCYLSEMLGDTLSTFPEKYANSKHVGWIELLDRMTSKGN